MKWNMRALWGAVTAAVLLAMGLCIGVLAAEPREETVRLPVVMYHHVSEREKLWGKYVVSPRELENDLAFLHQAGYESVSVERLLAWKAGEAELPEKPCIITFDDGYESTGVLAAPLLEKYGFTGVVAVIGSVAEQYSEQPDHDLRYSHLSWEAVAALEQSGVMEVQCHSWAMHELQGRKGCNRRDGESEWDYRAALTEDTERYLDGCAIHGVRGVPAVAYPFGAYCAETVKIMEELGFSVGFTCTERVNVLDPDDPSLMELGRFNRPHGVSTETFFAKWEE